MSFTQGVNFGAIFLKFLREASHLNFYFLFRGSPLCRPEEPVWKSAFASWGTGAGKFSLPGLAWECPWELSDVLQKQIKPWFRTPSDRNSPLPSLHSWLLSQILSLLGWIYFKWSSLAFVSLHLGVSAAVVVLPAETPHPQELQLFHSLPIWKNFSNL